MSPTPQDPGAGRAGAPTPKATLYALLGVLVVGLGTLAWLYLGREDQAANAKVDARAAAVRSHLDQAETAHRAEKPVEKELPAEPPVEPTRAARKVGGK